MKLVWAWMLVLLLAMIAVAGKDALAAKGGELGNSFVPFDSKLGEFSLEYAKTWRFHDLSQTANFTDVGAVPGQASFLTVFTDRTNGPQTVSELRDQLLKKHPALVWTAAKLSGLNGFESEQGGIRLVYLLRAPGDFISVKYRSTDGERTDSVIAHMLNSFRAE